MHLPTDVQGVFGIWVRPRFSHVRTIEKESKGAKVDGAKLDLSE